MPAYNAEQWIGFAIESVLAQTYERFELVVSDHASVDATTQIAGSYGDSRIRIDVASPQLDAVSNYNRSILLSSGKYIKFLHADDVIEPTCIEEMVALAREDPQIGLVFARREIVLEEPYRAIDLVWAEEHADLHGRFTGLGRINDGHDLFRQMLDAGLRENWVGEPSSVLATRECLVEIGLFTPRLRQLMDLELWLRVMLRYRIGFVDRVLSRYLHHSSSITGNNARLGRDWLDHLWLVEGLLREALPGAEREQVKQLRNAARRRALRGQAGRLLRRRLSGELADYASYSVRALIGRAPSRYPRLPETPVEHRGDPFERVSEPTVSVADSQDKGAATRFR